MLTVSILINGEPLYTRSARRQEDDVGEVNTYKTDAGDVVEHKYEDGILPLAKKIIDTIRVD